MSATAPSVEHFETMPMNLDTPMSLSMSLSMSLGAETADAAGLPAHPANLLKLFDHLLRDR
jgi:hypothetical protein